MGCNHDRQTYGAQRSGRGVRQRVPENRLRREGLHARSEGGRELDVIIESSLIGVRCLDFASVRAPLFSSPN